jgi:hypothetical protein
MLKSICERDAAYSETNYGRSHPGAACVSVWAPGPDKLQHSVEQHKGWDDSSGG